MPTKKLPPQPEELAAMGLEQPPPARKEVVEETPAADPLTPIPARMLQSAVSGDQPSLLGEGGLDAVPPVDRLNQEVDMIIQTLQRAFMGDVTASNHMQRLAANVRKLRGN